jgi:hypothetical protein
MWKYILVEQEFYSRVFNINFLAASKDLLCDLFDIDSKTIIFCWTKLKKMFGFFCLRFIWMAPLQPITSLAQLSRFNLYNGSLQETIVFVYSMSIHNTNRKKESLWFGWLNWGNLLGDMRLSCPHDWHHIQTYLQSHIGNERKGEFSLNWKSKEKTRR